MLILTLVAGKAEGKFSLTPKTLFFKTVFFKFSFLACSVTLTAVGLFFIGGI